MILGPFMGQQAQQAAETTPVWTPGDSASLVGAYYGLDQSTMTLTGDNVDEWRCAHGIEVSPIPVGSP